MKARVKVEISGRTLSASAKRRLVQAVQAALATVPRNDRQHKVLHSRPWLVHIELASASRVQVLNSRFRGKPKPTDVLSFPLWQGVWVTAPGEILPLGDIVLCPQVARKQCAEWGNTYLQELVRLTIHGTLHLLDYDHEKSSHEAKKMFALEAKALRKI
jgi:probable rRNA maturation factor